MRQYCFAFLWLCSLLTAWPAEGNKYKFRIELKDKGVTAFSTDRPGEYLSERAIERRKRQNIAIDESDLPISQEYIGTIEDLGCQTVAKSKWTKTITIQCEDSSIVAQIRELNFVKKADCVWISAELYSPIRKTEERAELRSSSRNFSTDYYGYASNQMKMVNGQYLHQQGYEGEGMQIAVIDGGFVGLEDNPLTAGMNIAGTKNFVYEQGKGVRHGFEVLSLMAANTPDSYVSSAPKAAYWLLHTEDDNCESPVEEDYWIAAAEYADSIGVDMINSSLGYYQFDSPFISHTWDELDGKSTLISRAAEMATGKGIFVVNSAGNVGSKPWKKIVVPADAEHVLTVGSVKADSIVSYFSSVGLAADGRIKPDIVALGEGIKFVSTDGTLYSGHGTSYSAPVMCGLITCLWEAFPDLTNYELLDIIRKSSHRYTNPDESYGYGIPNMETAFRMAKGETSGIEKEMAKEQHFRIYSLGGGLIKVSNNHDANSYLLTLYSLEGQLIFRTKLTSSEQEFFVPTNHKVGILNIKGKGVNHSEKIRF